MTKHTDLGERAIMAPPEDMIELAVKTARLSPCAKSKRGVVVFGRDEEMVDDVDAIANGFNGQPPPFECDGTFHCKKTCAKRCIHAEDRAIRQAVAVLVAGNGRHLRSRQVIVESLSLGDLRRYEAVHVKLDAHGDLTWGGGPSCWQCSRTVMDVNLGAFWLYEREFTEWQCPYSDLGKPDDECPFCARRACVKHPELAIASIPLQISAVRALSTPSRTDSWASTMASMRAPDSSMNTLKILKSPRALLLEQWARACNCSVAGRHVGLPKVPTTWRRYTAEEFHRATLKAGGL